jgi:hypothetical protein
MPHWPYVKAVDDALTARDIPPGTVRASHHGLERGLATYMTLAWDVSRTSGRGGIRLDWEERQGWYYALSGFAPHDVLLYTVITVLRTPMAAPETVADVAEELVRHRRLPEREFRTKWEGAQAVRDAANDFRRARLGLGPAGRADHGSGTREGVQLTIDTQTDTYEQAIAAVQAAYGLNPAAVASSWPDAPAAVPRPGPESLSDEDLGQGWTERMLFDTVAAVVPGARAVLRRLVEVGGTGSYEEVQDHFAVHPETPIDPKRVGGTLTSIRAVRRRVGPDNRSNLLERDDRRRIYWIEPALLEGLKRAFDLADARPDLLRQESAGS